jgi:hypothetical protein
MRLKFGFLCKTLILAYFNNEKLMKSLKKDWDRLLPFIFYYDHLYPEQQKEITQQLNEFYLDNQPISDLNRENVTNVRESLLWQ